MPQTEAPRRSARLSSSTSTGVSTSNSAATGAAATAAATTTSTTSNSRRRRRADTSNSTDNDRTSSTKMWNPQKRKKNTLSGINETAALALFDDMRKAEEEENDDLNVVTMEGIVHLGNQLGVDAVEDIRILVLLWKMGINEKPGCITRNEWMQGCSTLQIDSWQAIKTNQLPSLDLGFLTNTEFKDFYKFCFQFNRQGTHRTLDKDLVIALLKLTLKDRVPNDRLESFCDFLEQNSSPQYARITLDQWTSFWDFCMECPDLSSYDESTSAWPVLIDEYVDYMVQHKK